MINPCLTSAITHDVVSSPQIKVFRDPALVINFGFYSTNLDSICGVFRFSAVNYPSLTSLDSTVFSTS